MDIVIGIILIVAALVLVITVMLQDNKDKSLSGAIAGNSSSDTFYGKNKGKGTDRLLNKIVTVAAVVFAVLVLVSFIIQDDNDLNEIYKQQLEAASTETTVETSAVESTADETKAPETQAAETEAAETEAGDAA